MELKDHMDDRNSFEWAMFRVRAKAAQEGRNLSFREALDLAQKDLEAEHARLVNEVAKAKAMDEAQGTTAEGDDSSPSTEED